MGLTTETPVLSCTHYFQAPAMQATLGVFMVFSDEHPGDFIAK